VKPIDTRELLKQIRAQFLLDWQGIHGAPHWSRVLDNGLRLSELTGARADVVALFAFLHDARRRHDGVDFDHGHLAADYALELRGHCFEIDDAGFILLTAACRGHSDGLIEADVTIQTCWDADRLDLGRVGKRPDPRRLCTPAAGDPKLIEWAYQRSLGRPARFLSGGRRP
jgi:uncharacterized protein